MRVLKYGLIFLLVCSLFTAILILRIQRYTEGVAERYNGDHLRKQNSIPNRGLQDLKKYTNQSGKSSLLSENQNTGFVKSETNTTVTSTKVNSLINSSISTIINNASLFNPLNRSS